MIVGGQNGVGADGQVVSGGIGPQTEQALRNVIDVLTEAGATPDDVAKLTIYLVEGVDLNEGFAATRAVWGDRPTAISGVFVRGLARPDCLRGDRGHRRRQRLNASNQSAAGTVVGAESSSGDPERTGTVRSATAETIAVPTARTALTPATRCSA